ncbi:MAG: hypothetical protein HY317_04300 [Acidobacteria bacterium]|nr:hypothetical protein [Acidobacteriota bacterium]
MAEELRRIREAVRERALLERRPEEVRGPDPAVRVPGVPPLEAAPLAGPPPPRPDGAAVNALWDVGRVPVPAGLRGWLVRVARRLLGPVLDAQVAFNSRQVQLDNEILAYLDARIEATHRHYDAVLGVHGRHMQDVDERHLILQEELVAHVHDLVKRIDLVLSEAERGRLSLEFALRELRARLVRLEERLARG